MTSPPRSAYVAWAAVCVLWGTTYVAIRVALETVPPLLMTAFRWTTAGSVIVAVLKLRGEKLPPRSTWPSLTVLGVLLMGFGNGCVVWAEQTIPSGLTALLVSVVPFWMVGVEWVMGTPDRLTVRRIVGLIVGFAGIVMLVWPELQTGQGAAWLAGVAATQLACVGWALGSSYSRRRHVTENVLAAAALQMIFGGLCVLAVSQLRGERMMPAISARSASAVAYLVLVGSIAGFSAYAYALKYLPVTTVSLYAYVNPVIAVLLGTLLLGEPLSPRLAVAGVVVLAGIALVRAKSRKFSEYELEP